MMIENALTITQNEKREVRRCNILIEDGMITSVGDGRDTSGEVIDASKMIAIPGLINTHTHVGMTLLRGELDDLNLEQFLEKSFKIDAVRREEDVRASARAGIAEMISSGTTSFLDLYYAEDIIAEECQRAGIRGFLAWAVLDRELTTQKGDPLANAEHFIRTHRDRRLVTPVVGLQGVYACSRSTMLGARALAIDTGAMVHMHLCETRAEVFNHQKKYGMTPVRWLRDIGFLDGIKMVAAHCVWMTREEMSLLSQACAAASLCTRSNLKLASGLPSAQQLHEHGVLLTAGTDSATTSNNLDMFEEMRFLALSQKFNSWDASVFHAQQVLDMATVNAARALNVSDRIGSIEEGKCADIVLIDAESPRITGSGVNDIVYSVQGGDVCCTIIDGKIVYNRA
jgi:5-methylthioadenosine/S-adenosylhomocysteine deaminase